MTPYRSTPQPAARRPYKAPKLKSSTVRTLLSKLWHGQGVMVTVAPNTNGMTCTNAAILNLCARTRFWIPIAWVDSAICQWDDRIVDSSGPRSFPGTYKISTPEWPF